MITNLPRGTHDYFGEEVFRWQKLEETIHALMNDYHYGEMRTPMFEHTELFLRGVGDTTDIVNKEMYTFLDKGERSITLKPEGTAGAARAYLEHQLQAGPQPTKLYYITPCFRYEKPQAGRDRQFTQFGVELYGSASAYADCEVISIADTLLKRLGISNVSLRINSLGCPTCRKSYNEALKSYFAGRRSELCPTCQERLEKNPLRILDCKSPICQDIAKDAPRMLDYLDDECKAHFEEVQRILTAMGISFSVDPGIVRGLDYYTRTVFEFVCGEIGAQGTVCGGGRYDHLIEELGGDPTPAVGFGAGIGRLLLAQEASGALTPVDHTIDLYVGNFGPDARSEAACLVYRLRQDGISAEFDLLDRSVKAQMKYANKLGARYALILGEDELTSGQATLKDMQGGEDRTVNWKNLSELEEILK